MKSGNEDRWQPELGGKTLSLRPLKAEDFEALYDVASDPLIWEQHPENDRWKRDAFLRFFQGALDSRGALIVRERDSGRVVGSSRFHSYSPDEPSVVIGFTFLARDHWGKGTNAELKDLMLCHAFRWVKRVRFNVGAKNLRSRRAVEKLGAKLAEQSQVKLPDGRVQDNVHYDLYRWP